MSYLNGVSLFVQVAQAGSFVKAARIEGVSASAASKCISRLEQRLAVRLFNRNTRSLSLTEEGKIYLETCQRVLADLVSVESRLDKTQEQPHGVLRISLPMVGGLLLPALSDFSAKYPAVQMELHFTDHLVDVIAEGFDVVIRTGALQDSRLSARPLCRFNAVVVGSPAYFERKGIPRHPADLAHHDCVHYRFPHSGKIEAWRFSDAPNAHLTLPRSMVCNSLEARIHYAKRGLALAWVPDFSVPDELASGALLAVLQDYADHTDSLSMVWPSGQQAIPKLRAFIDFMSAQMWQT